MDPAGEADPFVVAGTRLSSRLLVGTGKFSAHPVMRAAVLASGTDLVTVALRRVDLDRLGDGDILDFVPAGVRLLPNTSGAVDAAEAVRLARLGRAGTGTDWVKLEVTPDPRTLAPDPIETLRAAELLVADGFTVLPYCSADPVLCRQLEEAGCATVMPLGAWIGSNRGLRTRDAIEVDRRAGGRAGRRRRRARRAERRGRGDGDRRRRGAGQHRDRGGERPGRDGAGVRARHRGRPARLPGRPGPVAGATTAEASSPLTGFLGLRPAGRRRRGGDRRRVPGRGRLMAAPREFAGTWTARRRRLSAREYDDATSTGRCAGHRDLADLAALLSPAGTAGSRSSPQAARETTLQRFGRAVRLFAPLYVCNACLSSCTYCGFAKDLTSYDGR